MENGEWEPFNGNALVFDNGVLCNGQHRLMAMVKANYTLTMVIIVGASTDAFRVMDIGKGR